MWIVKGDSMFPGTERKGRYMFSRTGIQNPFWISSNNKFVCGTPRMRTIFKNRLTSLAGISACFSERWCSLVGVYKHSIIVGRVPKLKWNYRRKDENNNIFGKVGISSIKARFFDIIYSLDNMKYSSDKEK